MNCKQIGTGKRQGRVLTRILPLLVWLMAVAGVAALYVHRAASFHVIGIATPQTQSLAAAETGLLLSLPVQLYQEVRQGQPLAVLRMNTASWNQYTQALLEAQKATAQAELERIKAEYSATEQQVLASIAQQENDLDFRERQLSLDVERARLKILEIQTSLEPDKIQITDLEIERKVLQELLDRKAIESYELQKVEVQYQMLAEKIRLEEQGLVQAREDLQQAQKRLDDFRAQRPSVSSAQILTEPLRLAIGVQEKRLAELFVPSSELVITAPFDGVISGILYSEGQSVMRGEEILVLTATRPDHVRVWLDQDQCGAVREQQEVQVVKTTFPRQIMKSRISRIGPMIELIPERLWKNPSVPEWGRPVMIPIHPDMHLIPNERVIIRGI